MESFSNETFVVLLFECIKKHDSQRRIFTFQTHPSKAVHKNMLQVWNFIKNKLCHGYFHINGQLMLRQLTNLNFKWRFHLYLLSGKCLPFKVIARDTRYTARSKFFRSLVHKKNFGLI